VVPRRALPLPALTVLLLLLAGLTACGGSASGKDGGGRPQVVAAFYPFAFVAAQVAGSDARVDNLTKPGQEPHDLELTPRQVGRLADAELVVYLHGFQPAVDEAVRQNAKDKALDVADVVTLERHGAEPPGHDHGATPDAHSESGATDPHVWQDPTKLAQVARALADRLAKADPGHAPAYQRRAADLVTRLDALDGEYKAGLAHCTQHAFVTSHAAFGYLAERYGLEQVSIGGLSPDAEPSPARLAAVRRFVKAARVDTVFFETLVSPKAARTLASEAGVRTDVLDPVEGLAPSAGPGADYFTVMRSNLTALRKALRCS
jgi:zinc transport system substrate-binding protein